ncbi:MAG TPA: hypothetical protein VIS94_15615 [Desulfomonilia bacterium]
MIDINDIMPIENIDDWEMRIKRQDAAWHREIIDRPVVDLTFFEYNPDYPFPEKRHASFEEWWLDTDFQVKLWSAIAMGTCCMGDALPRVMPNLGPDFFAACYGGTLHFEQDTSFIEPFLMKWDDADKLSFDWKNQYFLKLEEQYAGFLDAGKNKFYVSWPDIHPGADCLAGFRGPSNLAMDLYDNREQVKLALKKVTQDFFRLYDYYYDKLTKAHQPCTGWPGIVSTYKWHVPSNDFSYMISPKDFNEVFLEGLREENRYMEANVHHLDGPGCMRHLDSLLTIEELNMIQWVHGAGRGRASDYMDLYKKIQAAGKGIQLQEVEVDEVDILIAGLRPEGVWMHVNVADRDQAETVLKKFNRWK